MSIENEQSKIVLVNQTSGYLMIDIVNAYVESYDTVALIAGTITELDRKLHNSVICSKIVGYNKKTFFSRIFTWLLSTIQIFFLLLFKYRGFHVVYVTNPPLSYFSSLFLKNTYSVIIYDIYPDALQNVGITPNHFVFRIWVRINKMIFEKAVQIYTLSDGMADLLGKYCDRRIIKVIPNWIGSDQLVPVEKGKNAMVSEYGLADKFVVMYSGNIGYTHNVEVILEVAKRLQKESDICFFIIGEGLKKKGLIKIAAEANLKNCCFLSWQPTEKMYFSLSAADLSVVTLTEETAFVSVPSKTYNLLSVGSPLLCIAPYGSEIDLLVKKYQCGLCFEKDSIDEMVLYILKLKSDKKYKEHLSQNSLIASKEFTYKNAQAYVCEKVLVV